MCFVAWLQLLTKSNHEVAVVTFGSTGKHTHTHTHTGRHSRTTRHTPSSDAQTLTNNICYMPALVAQDTKPCSAQPILAHTCSAPCQCAWICVCLYLCVYVCVCVCVCRHIQRASR